MRSRCIAALVAVAISSAGATATAQAPPDSLRTAPATPAPADSPGTVVTPFPAGVPEIQAAIRDGDTELAIEIVHGNPDVARFRGSNGATLLHFSAEKGLDSLCTALIDAGADLEATATIGPMDNVVPLAAATITKQISTMALLLDRGANANALVGNRQSPLLLAVSGKSVDGARVLLDHGAVVDLADTYGTPLVHAAERGDSAMVVLLLARGADINTGTSASGEPLGIAAMGGHIGVVRLLLSRGADLQDTWAYFDSPSSIPAREQPDVAALLKRASSFGRAAVRGTKMIISSLSSQEPCFVNERIGGFTPLGLAVQGHHPDIVKVLLAAGADPNLLNDSDKTALDLAGDDVAMQNIIEKAGGKPAPPNPKRP